MSTNNEQPATGCVTLPDGAVLTLDEEGYLEDWQAWVPEFAVHMAARDEQQLQAEHWVIIDLLRDYYADFEIAPPMRALLKLLRAQLPDETVDSRRLYRLFPDGPAKQACLYAGLPRPVSCI